MKYQIFISCFFIFFLSTIVTSQEQTTQPVQLTQLTIEQKADRAVMNSISYMVFGISYAKSQGQTVAQYAEYCARTTAPFYQRFSNQPPIGIIRATHNVLQSDRNYQLEITESTDSTITGRMTLYGVQYINPENPFGGVTVDECYEFYNTFITHLLKSIGMNYSYKLNVEWIEFEIHK
ncbi:hypothetical protein JW960_00195 [candidate division KSB1 bacterium]|nr:hypothetical protein [candidate division KSB1 bacterium]